MIKIGDKQIDERKVYIVAEAGSNHNGDFNQAKRLIDLAAGAGADAVKFQTFKASKLYLPDSGKAGYLKTSKSIYQIIKEMEMPLEWIPKLSDYCKEKRIDFLSTPFDKDSAYELNKVNMKAFKIASYSLTDLPLLKYIASFGKPMIVSTGASTLKEIDDTVKLLKKLFVDIVLLQCVAKYPAPLEATNLKVLDTFKSRYSVPVGLSDHSVEPFLAPLAAVARGAVVIEKHFTINKKMKGPDHKFAIEPDELEEMVRMIRQVEKILGDGEKKIHPMERELAGFAKVAIHAVRDIRKGEVFSEEDIAILRPGKIKIGLPPKFYEGIIGKKAVKDIKKGVGVQKGDF